MGDSKHFTCLAHKPLILCHWFWNVPWNFWSFWEFAFSGEKIADCATGTIIGENSGVFVGGIPDDYILQREEEDSRAQVIDIHVPQLKGISECSSCKFCNSLLIFLSILMIGHWSRFHGMHKKHTDLDPGDARGGVGASQLVHTDRVSWCLYVLGRMPHQTTESLPLSGHRWVSAISQCCLLIIWNISQRYADYDFCILHFVTILSVPIPLKYHLQLFVFSGYAVYPPNFFSGTLTNIDHLFSFRTEFTSGLMFFAYGAPKSYYLVQMVAGGIYWEVSTANWRGYVMFPNTSVELCDGKWHDLRITKVNSELKILVTIAPVFP